MRASIVEVQTALNLGYTSQNGRAFGHRFNKGCRVIYGFYRRDDTTKPVWRTMDLLAGRYCNEVDFDHLVDALNRPINPLRRDNEDERTG